MPLLNRFQLFITIKAASIRVKKFAVKEQIKNIINERLKIVVHIRHGLAGSDVLYSNASTTLDL